MSPYSMDLRERVVAAHQADEGSIRELADMFHVAKNTIENWLHRLRETGSVAPLPHGGGVPATIRDERLDTLWRLVGERDDATLDELRKALERECRVHTSRAAVDRALRRVNFTRKRRRSTRTSGTDRTFGTPGRSSAWSNNESTPPPASSSMSSGSTST